MTKDELERKRDELFRHLEATVNRLKRMFKNWEELNPHAFKCKKCGNVAVSRGEGIPPLTCRECEAR